MKKILFSHKRYGDVAVVTACYLHIITVAEEYTLKYGGYYESPVETFDKQKSRKAALTDAIRDIRRDIRADVWEVYFEQFPDRKSKTAKKIAFLEKELHKAYIHASRFYYVSTGKGNEVELIQTKEAK